MTPRSALTKTDSDEVEALAFYLAALHYAERGQVAEQKRAEQLCMHRRARVEKERPWYAGTWMPLPSHAAEDLS